MNNWKQQNGVLSLRSKFHLFNEKLRGRSKFPLCQRGIGGFGSVLIFFFMLGCSSGKLEPDACEANIECGLGACVLETCVNQAADCRRLGTFVDISRHPLDAVDQLEEIHMTVDPAGAVHYCYWGFKGNAFVSRYGVQTGINSFNEVDLVIANGEKASCGAIAISSTGVPYVVSRIHPSFMYYENKQWYRRDLDALQGDNAIGAMASPETTIQLTPDVQGGMFAALSLGIHVSAQPVYIAHISDGAVTELVNGWVEDGTGSPTGYAPQIIQRSPDGGNFLAANIPTYKMEWQTFDGTLLAQKEGFYPRLALGAQGYISVAYMNRNFELEVASLSSNFETIATVKQIEVATDLRGRIPFEIDLDRSNDSHLLVEDVTHGYGKLSYYKVSSQGQVSDVHLVSNALFSDLPGNQQYAIGTDICGRSTIAFVEYETTSDEITGQSFIKPVLKTKEGY